MCYLASFAVKVNSTAHRPTEERDTKIGLGIFGIEKNWIGLYKVYKNWIENLNE